MIEEYVLWCLFALLLFFLSCPSCLWRPRLVVSVASRHDVHRAYRDVVHSPFEWLHHCRHCNCRDLVLFVGRLPWLCGPNVLWRCLRRDVVWWWRFHS